MTTLRMTKLRASRNIASSSAGPRTPAVPRAYPYVVAGAVCGLTWAAAIRGWMSQFAGANSAFTWLGAFGLVLAPGAVVGALLGWSAFLRHTARRMPRWLVWSPVVFAAAVADPVNFMRLIHTGEGGGELGIICFALAGGYALTRGGRRWLRICLGVLTGLGILVMGFMSGEQYPVSTAKGAWVGVYAGSLLAVLCLACAIPHRPTERRSSSAGEQG